MKRERLVELIGNACGGQGYLLSSTVLCESIGSSVMKDPVIVPPESSLECCLAHLGAEKSGAVLIQDAHGKLAGILTERDWILKIAGKKLDLEAEPVSAFMTREPVCERTDATIAFALNLMSHGGFRHLPVVDDSGAPIGIVSVKDVVDFFVERMMQGLVERCGPDNLVL